MQKKIIALAVASALAPAAAMADTTVYGQVHMSVDSNSGYTTTATTKQNGTEVVSSSSRLGFKGSEDLGGGLTAIFQLEVGVDLDGNGGGRDGNGGTASNSLFSNARDSWVGVAGDFGAVLAGRLPLANQYAYDVNYFADQVGDAGNFTAANGVTPGGRVNNAIAYATPNMSGFSFLIAYVPNTAQSVGEDNPADKAASYTLRGDYAYGPVKVGLSYQNVGLGGIPLKAAAGTGIGNALSVTSNTPGNMASGADLKNTSLSGTYDFTYDFGAGNVGLQYVHSNLDLGAGTSYSQNVYTLGGSFKVASNAAIKAQYSSAGNVTNTTGTGAQMLAVGYDYNFSKRTTGYVAYAQTWNKLHAAFRVNGFGHGSGTDAPAVGTSDDPSALSIGLVHSF